METYRWDVQGEWERQRLSAWEALGFVRLLIRGDVQVPSRVPLVTLFALGVANSSATCPSFQVSGVRSRCHWGQRLVVWGTRERDIEAEIGQWIRGCA